MLVLLYSFFFLPWQRYVYIFWMLYFHTLLWLMCMDEYSLKCLHEQICGTEHVTLPDKMQYQASLYIITTFSRTRDN
jgi:hypothetical protein